MRIWGPFHVSSGVDVVRILLKTGRKNLVPSAKQSQLRNHLRDSIKVFAPNKSDKITLPGQPRQFTTGSKVFRTSCSIPWWLGQRRSAKSWTAVRSDGACRPRRHYRNLQQFIFGTTLMLPGNYFPQNNSRVISGWRETVISGYSQMSDGSKKLRHAGLK
jgi:hypothetical protein